MPKDMLFPVHPRNICTMMRALSCVEQVDLEHKCCSSSDINLNLSCTHCQERKRENAKEEEQK